jgi:hypothetical protein
MPIEISNGSILFDSVLAGRWRLLMVKPGRDPVPFVQTEEDTWGAVPLGEKEIGLFAGRVGKQGSWTVVLASAADGRIVRRLEATNGDSWGLAASPDARNLYYIQSRDIWTVPVAGGPPHKLVAGDAVAPDPNGQDLIVLRTEKDAVHLFRVPLPGGAEQPIPFHSEMRLGLYLASNAVGKDGRILVNVKSLDSRWYQVGILDSKTGKVERLVVPYSGDILYPGWTPDGRILADGSPIRATLWRYRRETK